MNLTVVTCLLAMSCDTFARCKLRQTSDGAETAIYVQPQGDDSQSGDQQAPKKTLRAAIKAVRGNGVPTTIWVGEGVYPIESAITLSKADSRTAETPLTIRSIPNETVVLSAGGSIQNSAWQQLKKTDRLASVVDPAAGNKIMTADLSASPLKTRFQYRPDPNEREKYALLSWNGYVLQQAMWPNKGYASIAKVLAPGPKTRDLKATEKPATYSFEKPTGGSFTVQNPPELSRLQEEFELTGDMQIHGYLHNDWYFQTEAIGRVSAAENKIQLVRYTRYGLDDQHIKLARRFRIVNAVSQIDLPGEWCYDKEEEKLYLWPVEKPKPKSASVSVVGKNRIFEGKEIDHINIIGLKFQNFSQAAIRFSECNHILVAGCEFRAGQGTGCRLMNGTHNTIQSCDFHDLGGAAVLSGIDSNRRDLIQEHNKAINNHIWNCRGRGYGAFTVRGVGVYFAHNLMHHMNSGIVYGSNDFIGEYNEFYDVGNEMGDWNVAYNGADLSLQNNVFRYNFFHHFMETPGAHPIAAVRADDGASGMKIHSNILMKTGRAGVMFNGPNCEIVGNFLLDIPLLLWTIQQPYDSKLSNTQFLAQKREDKAKIEAAVAQGTRKFDDKDNIVAKAEAVFGAQGWKTNKAWINKYPNFANHFDFHNFDQCPWNQSFSRVKDNYMDDVGKDFPFHFHGKRPSSNSSDAKKFLPKTAEFLAPKKFDPSRVFVQPGQMDFTFKPNAKLVGEAKPFDFEKVGLVVDEYRTTVPDKQSYRTATKRKYRGISSDGGRQSHMGINDRFQLPSYLEQAE